MSPAPDLAWCTSASADAENHDQEVDLAALGAPGGAAWASVAPDSSPGPWAWVIYDRWIDVDSWPDPVLAEGPAGTEAEAKAAVQAWVRDHPAAPAEQEDRPAMIKIRTDPLRGALLRMMINAARSLNEPGETGGEYARGQAELICDTAGLDMGEYRDGIIAVITKTAPIAILTRS
jgi:hypothetical protein